VVRVDPTGGSGTVVSAGGAFFKLTGVAVEADGGILVTGSSPGDAALIRVDPVTGAQTQVSSGGALLRPHGIALEVSAAV